MKNITLLFAFLLSFTIFGQVENIVNMPGYINNESELYVYGINAEGGIEVNTLNQNFELLNNVKIEKTGGSEPFFALSVQDAGSLLLINCFNDRSGNYRMFHLDKSTKKVISFGEQGGLFVNENVKVRSEKNEDLLLLDHLKIYPHFIRGKYIYILQQSSKNSLLYYGSNFSISSLTVNCFNNKGNDRLIKCHAVVGEDDGFVWLEKDWEKDLGIESEKVDLKQLGENFVISHVTKKDEISFQFFDIKTEEITTINLNNYSIKGLTTKSTVYLYSLASTDELLFTIDIENNGKNVAYLKLDSNLKAKGELVIKNLYDTEAKLTKDYWSTFKDYNGKVYFSNAYFKISTSTNSNESELVYKENINGYIVDGKVDLVHMPTDKREIEKGNAKFNLVPTHFVVKNGKIFNLYVNNAKNSLSPKKECNFLFYCTETDEYLETTNLSQTVTCDDMISTESSNKRSKFIVSLDGKKMLWLCLISEYESLKYKPDVYKVFIDEI